MTQPEWGSDSRIRFHGESGPMVIALHGGPGACGSALRLARGLSNDFRVLEPWQRTSGDVPLSVAVHVEDLYRLICSRCPAERPVLVGESWGAMLALAYAAEYSETINGIVLVGCGTFDQASREVIGKTRRERILDYIAMHPEHKADLELDYGQQIMKWHGMTDGYEPVTYEEALSEPFDMQGHTETWEDMMRCQEENIYPHAFGSVKIPALMLHGMDDPHPGEMIRDNLRQFIPHLEYYELERCGHDPVVERYARSEFFVVLKDWLRERAGLYS